MLDILPDNNKKYLNKLFEISYRISRKKLMKDDLEVFNLTEKSLLEMAEEGDLNKIIVSKIGHYLGQSIETILLTKMYDICHNKLRKKGEIDIVRKDKESSDNGICFWSLKRLPLEHTKKFLEDDIEKSFYVIMPYVDSTPPKEIYLQEGELKNYYLLNPRDDEDLEEFYLRIRNKVEQIRADKEADRLSEKDNSLLGILASKYALSEDDLNGFNAKPYPDLKAKMFPEVLNKESRNVAFLVSKLYYSKEDFEAKRFYEFFSANPYCAEEKTLSDSIGASSCSHMCAKLKPERKEDLITYLKNCSRDGKFTGCIIAKIEFPYIVAIN